MYLRVHLCVCVLVKGCLPRFRGHIQCAKREVLDQGAIDIFYFFEDVLLAILFLGLIHNPLIWAASSRDD